MDHGHELTEIMLGDLEKRIANEYAKALRDMKDKVAKYFKNFEEDDKRWKEAVAAGERTEEDYKKWRFKNTMVGRRWTQMRDTLAQELEKAKEKALKLASDKMPDVFALNGNYATYQIEHDAGIDTSFTLYNHDTADFLLKENRQLMPGPSTKKEKEIAANEALQWDKDKIQSAVLQGVMQGETPEQIAQRLMGVGQMDYNSAIRYARTMTTNAQNAGRYEAIHRAANVGVDLVVEWEAVLDNRTRHSHRMMHGQRREVDEPFVIEEEDGTVFEIMYPGDCSGRSDAPQGEIWNCRCTLLSWVKGFEGDTVKEAPGMGDLTFEEWQQGGTNTLPSSQDNGKISASVADQNTGKIVSFDPNNDYSIHVENYSNEVNDALSDVSRWLAENGTKDQVEWLSLVDLETGEAFYREPGDLRQTGTNFWDVVNRNEDRKIAFLHNHCLDGSLSAPDMEVMLQSDQIRCIIAIRNDGVKYVAPRNDAPTPYKFLFQLYGDKSEEELVDLAIRDYTEGYFEHDGRK